jgi:hypothetical protein
VQAAQCGLEHRLAIALVARHLGDGDDQVEDLVQADGGGDLPGLPPSRRPTGPAPTTTTAVSGLPRAQAGVAGALASTGRQFGIAVGVAVTGSIVTGSGEKFISASHAAWAVLGGCGLLALLLGVVSTGSWARAAADRNGERLAAGDAGS